MHACRHASYTSQGVTPGHSTVCPSAHLQFGSACEGHEEREVLLQVSAVLRDLPLEQLQQSGKDYLCEGAASLLFAHEGPLQRVGRVFVCLLTHVEQETGKCITDLREHRGGAEGRGRRVGQRGGAERGEEWSIHNVNVG